MAEFKAFRPDVEVYGTAVLALVDGMGHFTTTARKILVLKVARALGVRLHAEAM